MNSDLQPFIDSLLSSATDPFPRFIIKTELLGEQPTAADIDDIHALKWYRQLADEQQPDGSWGRFHSMDARINDGRRFVSTEAALRRARELALTKDDPVVARAIGLMERYVTGEAAWPDYIEKHHDNGRSHLRARPHLTAAWISLFDPANPLIAAFREVFVSTLKIALADKTFDEAAWLAENRSYRGPCLNGWNVYPLMIIQTKGCIDDALQRRYLDYIWHKKEGIYYISNFPAAQEQPLENKRFTTWLSALESLQGFSLFPEFMGKSIRPHLLREAERILTDDVKLPPAHPISGHYSESWRGKDARKQDMALRILRTLNRC